MKALKLIAPIIVAAATLGIMPAALAASVAPPVPATASPPAPAVRVVVDRAGTTSPAVTDTGFHYWGTYNTSNACNAEGRHLWAIGSITHWKCTQYNRGDYFVYELFVMLGHNPGS